MPGDHQVLAGTGADDEEQASFALDIEVVQALIVGGSGDGGRCWHLLLANSDDSDTAEFQQVWAGGAFWTGNEAANVLTGWQSRA